MLLFVKIKRALAMAFGRLAGRLGYNISSEMCIKDMLTGLLNRNYYQQRLECYKNVGKHSIACVYCDVNGLHELNNTKGHEAGDRMLIFVAETMQKQFGEEHTYRIGGDEFVAFAPDAAYDDVEKRAAQIKRTLAENNYYASIGISWSLSGAVKDICALVERAEENMYKDKHRYYQEKGTGRRTARKTPERK